MNPDVETRYIASLQWFWHYAKSFSYMKSATPTINQRSHFASMYNYEYKRSLK
ncbi:hypothetical protein [Fischerella thermalis]|uniref:hypothetical protein n=1 Tax=Fischerella thermalis TaxID=372787 RepID=UPI0015E0C88C